MEYATAIKHAQGISSALQPLCSRVEIAGSIRRHRAACGDIDLVVEVTQAQRRAVIRRCMETKPEVLAAGNLNFRIRLRNGVQVELYFVEIPDEDLFCPQPSTWGTRLLCRTGSREFNVWFAAQALARNLHWNPYWGLYIGSQCVASATEQDMFRALKLDFIDPLDRER
jgi:DNA polymerase (family 10)